MKKAIKMYFFDKVGEIFKASSPNLKLQNYTLKINSILDKGLCYFYKLIEIFEDLLYSINLKKWMNLSICDKALKID